MKSADIELLKNAFSILQEDSLNNDPASFKGKFVADLPEENKVLKMMTAYDAAGELQILRLAQEQNINFFVPYEIIYQDKIVLIKQPKLQTLQLPTFSAESLQTVTSLNAWVQGDLKDELTIALLVKQQYGNEEYEKIKEFCHKYYLGNIYWRNIGFTSDGKIKCFDWYCGKGRHDNGEYYV